MRHQTLCKLIAVAVTIGVVIAQFALPVKSQQGVHGDGHDKLHHWYMSLYDRGGKSCCNMQDCRPTLSRVRGEDIEMLVDGEWTVVPPEKILNKSSPDLGDHVCSPPAASNYPKGTVFCAVLGSGV